MDSSCLDLAMEGQRCCKLGDYRTGVSYFQSAIQVGTEDLQLLSAIYCQMGNAYYQLKEYGQALEYYGYDFTLTSTIGDEAGEAKACGNLGNTLKVVGRCDEAVPFCQRQLDITRAGRDEVGQAQALYIFGNVYHAKAMEVSWSGVEPGHFTPEATAALRKAVQYYEANLCLVKERGDRAAEGHAYGKLGHTYHLLGDFKSAVAAHEKRLLIAEEFGDKSAERRAHCNLGSTHMYLEQYDAAVYHYKKTLQLSRQLKERAMEAQVCYSLGNTYTLLQDLERAAAYYLKHLVIAQELNDRVGEGRVCCTLGNIHTALGNHEQAINFTEKHLEIAIETGDTNGAAIARMNLLDLQHLLQLKSKSSVSPNVFGGADPNGAALDVNHPGSLVQSEAKSPSRTDGHAENRETGQSPEKKQSGDSPSHLDLEDDTLPGFSRSFRASTRNFLFQQLRGRKTKDDKSPSKDPPEPSEPEPDVEPPPKTGSQAPMGEDGGLLDLLSRFQGHRMDDQRCTLDGHTHFLAQSSPPLSSSSPPPLADSKPVGGQDTPSHDPGHFLELLASSQARRLNDQRVSLSHFPGLRLSTSSPPPSLCTSATDRASSPEGPPTPSLCVRHEATEPSDDDAVFLDKMEKCQVSRWNDQRSSAPRSAPRSSVTSLTIPDEDFFALILRSQSKRMEEQRVPPPADLTRSPPQQDGP
ncbi:unnamed protein product [Ophioblennius macclurei]